MENNQAIQSKAGLSYGYVIVGISFFVLIFTLGLHSIFGIFLKPIIIELGWSRAVTSGAFSLSVIMGGIIGIFMGGLNDRFGPRLVIAFSGFIFGLGFLLMSYIQEVWQIYIFLGILVGAGNNTYVPILSTVARWFTRKRGMMTGITFSGVGFGMLGLPLLVNHLILTYDWRQSFFILGIVVVVVVVILAQFLKRDPSQSGAAVTANGDLALAHGDSTGGLSPREVASTAPFWMFVIALFCYGFVFFSIQVHLAPYITDLGFSASGAAAVLAVVGGATILGQLGLGSAGDRLGFKQTFLVGMILITLATLLLMFGRDLWAFILLAAFLGLGFGDCSTMESPIAAWLFGLKYHGVILGFFAFSFTVGAAVGPLLFGYVFDTTHNYQLAFTICIVLAVIAVLMTYLVRRPVSRSALKPDQAWN